MGEQERRNLSEIMRKTYDTAGILRMEPRVSTAMLDEWMVRAEQLEAQVRVLAEKLGGIPGNFRCPTASGCWWPGCSAPEIARDRYEECSKEKRAACWLTWSAEKAEVQDECI